VQALQVEDLRRWCEASPGGVKLDLPAHLRYANGNRLGFRLEVPSEAPRAVALVSSLLAVEEDDGDYYGALLWFTNFDTGTPRIERCGLRILEQMRRGYGVTASVENAPGHLFRTDEIADVHAFLALPLLFGWTAYFVPHGTRYFAYARPDASLYLVTDDDQVLQRLLTHLAGYHPVLQLPSYLRDGDAEGF
jgi:hypothetical protein